MPALSPTPEPEVHEQESPPAQLSLDDEPEGPEEKHVADQMENAGVHEVVRQPLERVDALAEHENPVFVPVGREHDEYEHVDDDHRDRGDRPVVDRGIGPPGDDHRRLTSISSHPWQ